MNDWVINHVHAIVSPKSNDCVNINVSFKNENKYVTNLWLLIYVIYLHNNMACPVLQGWILRAQDGNNKGHY